MCTAIRIKHLFGRNLDLDYDFKQNIIFIGSHYDFHFTKLGSNNNHYKILGMGIVIDNYPLFSDAFNECGLAGAGLNFPNNAFFFKGDNNKNNISPYELIPFVLSNFKNIKEVKDFLKNANLIDIPFSKNLPNAPLHYIFADKDGCIVLEQTKEGLAIYDDEFDVLTNNPPFPFHRLNALRYLKLSNEYPSNQIPTLNLSPDSIGFGSIGLPGDYSSSSRFIKAMFLAKNIVLPENEEEKVTTFINALTSLSFIRGVAKSKNNQFERTIYSSCMNLNELTYSYKLEFSNKIITIKMNDFTTKDIEIKSSI